MGSVYVLYDFPRIDITASHNINFRSGRKIFIVIQYNIQPAFLLIQQCTVFFILLSPDASFSFLFVGLYLNKYNYLCFNDMCAMNELRTDSKHKVFVYKWWRKLEFSLFWKSSIYFPLFTIEIKKIALWQCFVWNHCKMSSIVNIKHENNYPFDSQQKSMIHWGESLKMFLHFPFNSVILSRDLLTSVGWIIV